MSVPLPAALVRAPVTWELGHADTTGPLEGASGFVLFEASAIAVAYSDRTVLPKSVKAPIVDGRMESRDLIVNDPDVWNWKVTVHVGAPWEPFHINVPAEGTDLASASITPGKGPVRVLKGDPGGKGEQGDEGPAGPYGGTVVTDPQVASFFDPARQTRAVADSLYINPLRRVQYVDATGGSDSNTGQSPTRSKRSLQAAVDALGADGGTVYAFEGIYDPVTITHSGLELRSLGGRRKTTIRATNGAANGVTYLGQSATVTSVQHRLVGFTIIGPGKNSAGTGSGISIKWTSVDLTVEDCHVTEWGMHGVKVEDSYSLTFRNTLASQNGFDGFHGERNFNNVTFDRTISILNNGNGYCVIGGTTVLAINADAESNGGAGFDLRYVTAANLMTCHMESNGKDGSSPNVYLHFRGGLGEKTSQANLIGCLIQGGTSTQRGVVIDGASRTTLHGNWFSNHPQGHIHTTSNADRTWIGPNTYAGSGTAITDGSATTALMDYDQASGTARTNILRFQPRTTNPASVATGQLWFDDTSKKFKFFDGTAVRTITSA